MLTLQTIKADPEYVIARLAVKGFDGKEIINKILDIDAERRKLQQTTESDASELKKLASSIGALMKEGKKDEADAAKARVAELKGNTKKLQDRLAECLKTYQYKLSEGPVPFLLPLYPSARRQCFPARFLKTNDFSVAHMKIVFVCLCPEESVCCRLCG